VKILLGILKAIQMQVIIMNLFYKLLALKVGTPIKGI